MRNLILLLVASSAVGSCMMAPQDNPQMISPREQAELAQLTAGKVAGPPVSCLSRFESNDMITVNDRTVAFRVNRGKVYLNGMEGGCPNLRSPYTLVTRQFTSQLCRGEIAQIVDTSSGASVGSCVFGDFIPYTMPRG